MRVWYINKITRISVYLNLPPRPSRELGHLLCVAGNVRMTPTRKQPCQNLDFLRQKCIFIPQPPLASRGTVGIFLVLLFEILSRGR